MNSLYETEVLQSQRGQPDQDTGGSDSRKNKTNKFSGRTKGSVVMMIHGDAVSHLNHINTSKRARCRKRNREGHLAIRLQNSNVEDLHEINMNNVVTSEIITNTENGNVEVIDVEQLKDLPVVDLTADSRNDIYVDLTRELSNSSDELVTVSPAQPSVICLSPCDKGQPSQLLQQKNEKKDDVVLVAQGSERVVNVPKAKDHPVSCAICLDNYLQIKKGRRQLTSTICGHVFCNRCITDALTLQAKCPTCRRKITRKQLHPLFL